MNNLLELINYGQSYWLDNITRDKLLDGELKKRVEEEGLRGVTSNPSIFYNAISGSNSYDQQIAELVKENKSTPDIYEEIAVKDVQDACDVMKPVFDSSDGLDGYVSIEVSPYLANDTEGTMVEARRLFAKVNRPNCLIKIPGTEAGVPAIEQMLYEGISINVTLLFSIDSYEKVANAYINALKRRSAEGKSLKEITSVASFFLSRIDVLTDKMIKQLGNNVGDSLLGETAVSVAKLVYQSFKKIFSGSEWDALVQKGARVQRPLWASTSSKDPANSDVKYVNPLIGKDTVTTLPDITIKAFKDHGVIVEDAVEKDIEKAIEIINGIEKIGLNLDEITNQLTVEGVQKFIDSYDALIECINDKI